MCGCVGTTVASCVRFSAQGVVNGMNVIWTAVSCVRFWWYGLQRNECVLSGLGKDRIERLFVVLDIAKKSTGV